MVLNVTISQMEWVFVQANINLATSASNTYISLSEGFVTDINAMSNIAITLPVGRFTPNTNPPVLISGTVDIEMQSLGLLFSEGIDISSLELRGISVTFTNAMTGLVQRYNLTGGTDRTIDLSNQVGISLILSDFEVIRNAVPTPSSFFISLAANTVLDGNGMPNINQENVSITAFNIDRNPPIIIQFDFDLNTGSMSMVFSEIIPTNQGDINYSLMFLTGSTNQEDSVNLNGSTILSVTNIATTSINLQLSSRLLNTISGDADLCTSLNNCFLFWGNNSFRDFSNNSALESLPLPPTNFIQDMTLPSLIAFSINLSNGNLSLTFSELVNISGFQVSALTFTSGNTSLQEAVNGSVVENLNGFSANVDITLTANSLNFAKRLQMPRLAAQSAVTSDTSGNMLIPIDVQNSLLPTNVIRDQIPPTLLSISPNVPSTRQILLTFNEFVNTASWNGNQLFITLQIFAGDLMFTSFTGGSLSPSVSDRITYTFSDSEFNTTFSSQYMEGYDNGSIIFNVGVGLLQDVSGNPLLASGPFTYSTQSPDLTSPALTGFDLDMNTGQVRLSFSEAVNILSIAGGIQFSDQISTINQSYILAANGTVQSGMGPLPILDFILSPVDLNALKKNRQLCSSRNDSFLIVSSGLAEDRNGNEISANMNGIQVSSYIPDVTPPSVTNFSLDLNAGALTIQFSEPILTDQSSINFTQLQLTNSSSAQNGISISESVVYSTQNFDTQLTILLSLFSLNSIKFDQTTCTSETDCFLYIAPDTFSDTNNNFMSTGTNNLPVSALIPDRTSPLLLSYELDMDVGLMPMTFSEPVNSVTFNPTGITLVIPSSGLSFSITDAFVTGTSSLSTVIQITLGTTSLNFAKLLNSDSNIQLTTSSLVAMDLSVPPNSIVPSSGLTPTVFIPDTTPPLLTRFLPGSPNASNITFIFNEFVNSSTFSEDRFTMTLSTRRGTIEYSGFRGGRISSTVIGSDQVVYSFSPTDFNSSLMSQFSEAIANGSVSLVIGERFISDLSGNVLLPITIPLQFTMDNIRPQLINFTLDLNMGFLDLSFNEAVNILSVAGNVRFQDTADNPNTTIILTQNGTIVPSSVAADSIVIIFDETDLNDIKVSAIGSSVNNTFLVLQQNFARDLSSNLIVPSSSGLQAFSIVLDTSRPTLEFSTINLNQETLQLTFSESISTASLNASRIYLTGMVQAQPTGYNLSGSAHAGPNLAQSVTLTFSQQLLNTLKADLQVCTSISNCLIFIEEGALSDVSGNTVIPSSTSTMLTAVIEDTIPPMLNSYTLDLNSGTIVLTFSEPISVQSFNPDGITGLAASSNVRLTDTSILVSESFNTVLRLSAGSSLLNQLKSLASMGSISLSINSSSATDTNGNFILPIPPSNSLIPSSFSPDISPPDILQFIPSSGGQLHFTLVFNEFVHSSSITRNLLSFRLKNRNGFFDYSDLSSAILTPDVSDRITFTFPPSETRFTDRSFQELYLSSYNEGSICFNLANAFVADLSDNRYEGNLLIVYTNSSDTVRPQLISFTLNLNTSVLNMTFSEEVNVLTVAGNVRFQNSATPPLVVYNLMQNGTIIISQSAPPNSVAISLAPSDLNNIINNPSIASSILNTYLFLLETFAVDNSGNLLNDTQSPTQASQVTQVIIGTMLLTFDLDLDSNIMTLQFDRGVNVSTFDSTRITLTNVSDSNTTSRTDVQLNRVEVIAQPGSIVSSFRFVLGVNDSIDIKRSILCYNSSNCFAVFSSGLILDSTGNGTVPQALQVSTLFLDVTPPRLVAFPLFDLNQGSFTLIFNEPVDGSSASVTDIQFSDRITNPTVSVTLREGFTTRDHIVITFFISRRDLNTIKLITDLCTSRDNCWIRLPSFFINDIGMNPFLHSNFQPNAQASFHQPLSFLNDIISPELISFSVDLTSGNMSLTFSEVIVDTSFYPENITLLDRPSGSISLKLSRMTNFARSLDGDEIYLTFIKSDLDAIKRLSLYTTLSNSYLSFVTKILVDTSGNVLTNIVESSPLLATSFVPDMLPPSMISFDLYNNDNGSIIVSFNEPVDIASLQFTEISLLSQSFVVPSVVTYTLTGGTSNYLGPNQLALIITLTAIDLREVKLLTDLATSQSNTYISITNNTILDRSGNSITPIPLTDPLQLRLDGFVSDVSRASLAGYTFDLTSQSLSLTFTDILDISTLDITRLTIQNSVSAPSESYTLVTSITSSVNSDTFDILLGQQDLNTIQLNLNLATSASNTFITFPSSLIRDISGLEVIPVQSSSALGPATYVADQISPQVVSFNLDMDISQLSLFFSEAVVVRSVSVTELAFQNDNGTSASLTYRLTSASMIQAINQATSLSLQISLSYSDLNTIKSIRGLASGLNDTFLRISENFITDTNGNLIQPSIIQAAEYRRDATRPTLLFFDLDFITGILHLQFSEAISYTPTAAGTVVLQNTPFNPSFFIRLTTQDVISLPTLDSINITLRTSVALALNNNPTIASSNMMLYISIGMGGFSDFANNGIVTIPFDQAMMVRKICKCFFFC